MPIRLSTFGEKLVESGWLMAFVVVPLFLNVYSYRVFEPDKLSLFRTLATFMAVSAMVLLLGRALQDRPAPAEWRDMLRRWLRWPLVMPALAVVLVYLLATAWSVLPRISLWGSYQRLQGTYTTLCYVSLFACILLYMRRREQIARATTAMILTSVPVVLYGLLQHHGMDPLPWQGDVTARVTSTLGNAIFLGAYLVMVIPLVISWIIEACRHMAGAGTAGRWTAAMCVVFAGLQVLAWLTLGFGQAMLTGLILIGTGLLICRSVRISFAVAAPGLAGGFILAAQLVALLYSSSRGPQIGLLSGLALYALLYVAPERRRRLAVGILAAGGTLIVLLFVFNLPNSPLAAARSLPYIGRLGRLFEIERGTGKVRVLIWQGSVDLLADDPLRALVGYGPETMALVYNRYYPAELAQYEARTASPDRAHNETFDALITTGMVGLVAQLTFFGAVLHHGLRALGLVPSEGSRRFLAVATLGPLVGILLPLLLDGSLRLAGVGLQIGAAAGVGAFVAWTALSGSANPTSLDRWQQGLIMAMLAGIVAHWIEISVGIAIAATRVHFWAFAAMIAALSGPIPASTPSETVTLAPIQRDASRRSLTSAQKRSSRRARATERNESAKGAQSRLYALASGALVASVVLATLAWNLVSNPEGAGPLRALAAIFWGAPDGVGLWAHGTFWMILGVWAIFTLALLAAWAASAEGVAHREGNAAIAIAAGIPPGIGLVYALGYAAGLGPTVDAFALLNGYGVWLLGTGIGIAIALYHAEAPPSLPERTFASLYVIVPAAALLLAFWINARPIKADMVYKRGLQYDAAGRWELAVAEYESAAEMAPAEDYYWLFAGRARLEQARAEADDARRPALFRASMENLEIARALSPLNTDHTANLARAYRAWAEGEPDPAARASHLSQALQYYERAVVLSPQSAQLYNEWGMTYAALGDAAEAHARYAASLALDDRYVTTYLLSGDLYVTAADWAAAIARYEQAVQLSPDLVPAWSRLSYAYAQAGRLEQAIGANQNVLELKPADYATLQNLAYLYHAQADDKRARQYLEQAMALAPAGERAILQAFGEQLGD